MSEQKYEYRKSYKKLQGWMVTNDVSRKDIAASIDSTVNTVGKKLNRKGTDFRLSEARKIHDILGAPMAYFFDL